MRTGYVACDYTDGDRLSDVRHGRIRASSAKALADYRRAEQDGEPYQGIRYIHSDGYLYVERP
jgi:hypothetical protein